MSGGPSSSTRRNAPVVGERCASVIWSRERREDALTPHTGRQEDALTPHTGRQEAAQGEVLIVTCRRALGCEWGGGSEVA